MSESEALRLVRAASLEISASVAETMRQARALDDSGGGCGRHGC